MKDLKNVKIGIMHWDFNINCPIFEGFYDPGYILANPKYDNYHIVNIQQDNGYLKIYLSNDPKDKLRLNRYNKSI